MVRRDMHDSMGLQGKARQGKARQGKARQSKAHEAQSNNEHKSLEDSVSASSQALIRARA